MCCYSGMLHGMSHSLTTVTCRDHREQNRAIGKLAVYERLVCCMGCLTSMDQDSQSYGSTSSGTYTDKVHVIVKLMQPCLTEYQCILQASLAEETERVRETRMLETPYDISATAFQVFSPHAIWDTSGGAGAGWQSHTGGWEESSRDVQVLKPRFPTPFPSSKPKPLWSLHGMPLLAGNYVPLHPELFENPRENLKRPIVWDPSGGT